MDPILYSDPRSLNGTSDQHVAMAGSTRVMLLVIAAIQTLLWLLAAPEAIHQARTGEISVLAVASCASSMCSLLIASVLLMRGRPSAIWFYLAAAALGLGTTSLALGPVGFIAVGVSGLSAAVLWQFPLPSRSVA